MATGDNMRTAISVARQCNILDEKRKTWIGELETEGGHASIKWSEASGSPSNESIPELKPDLGAGPLSPQGGKLPWNYKDPMTEVAVSGKLMRHLYDHRDSMGYIYRAVLARANVFARCAPDDKAMLVSSY